MGYEETPEITGVEFEAMKKKAHELGLHYTGVDLLELADVIVPGFDNVVFSPRHWL